MSMTIKEIQQPLELIRLISVCKNFDELFSKKPTDMFCFNNLTDEYMNEVVEEFYEEHTTPNSPMPARYKLQYIEKTYDSFRFHVINRLVHKIDNELSK